MCETGERRESRETERMSGTQHSVFQGRKFRRRPGHERAYRGGRGPLEAKQAVRHRSDFEVSGLGCINEISPNCMVYLSQLDEIFLFVRSGHSCIPDSEIRSFVS